MVNFEEHFWGDKYNGFDVLQQNFKLGFNASKELAEFIKERSSIEETYSKSLLKLATKCATVNTSIGTFEPCWKFLQSSTEKLANVHSQVIHHLSEVGKVAKEYNDQQKEQQKQAGGEFAYKMRLKYSDRKKHNYVITEMCDDLQEKGMLQDVDIKVQMKDSFSQTSEAVLNLQNLSVALVKAKELYQTRCQEVDKYRKDFNNLKDIKSAEIKFKKSTEDYKQLVEKRETARKVYHEKMTDISQKLQTIEEKHLTRMAEILNKYGESIKVDRFLRDQIIEEFERNMAALTVENLLQQFINTKQTGKDLPNTVEFEEVEINSMPVDIDAIAQAIKEEKKNKKKERRSKMPGRRKKKEKVDANGSVEQGDNSQTDPQNELQLDEEGYVIRPIDSESVHSSRSKMSGSSSDSETDSDDENHKIQVRIKPVGEIKGSNSDLTEDQLKKLSATLTLMAPGSLPGKASKENDKKFVATWGSHSSLNKLSAKSRSNNDLLNIDNNSDTASLHSLPVNSNIHGLEKSLSTENNHMDDMFTASSPVSSPTRDDFIVGPSSISPSGSFDQSVESLPTTNNNTFDDVAPPLPIKSRTMSLDTATNKSKNSSPSNEVVVDTNQSNTIDFDAFNAFPRQEEIKSETSRLKVDEQTTTEKANSLPTPSSKSTSSFEPLKPPPTEKRLSTALPPPLPTSSRGLPSNSTSLPRPKPGQFAPPTLPAPSTATSSSSSSVNRRMQASASTGSLPNNNNSQSSLSDLMDINFSLTNAPVLAPEKENMTSHWVNPDTDTESESSHTITSESDSQSSTLPALTIPPVLPRRATMSTTTTTSSTTSSAPVSPTVVDRTIPIAVAFIETVSGVFKGADEKSCIIKVTGDMTISFPANIISMFINNEAPPVLSFLITGTSSLEQIFPNKALVERGGQLPGGEGMTFKFNMTALAAYLKKQSELGTKASYYNIDILKYQVRCNGMLSAPLQLSAYWRCDAEQTDLKIDYKYNSSCMSTPVALNNVSVVVPVDGGVTIMQSKPTAIWSSEHQRCMWKLSAISAADTDVQALRARFEITRGPSTPVPIAVQFTGEGTTISLLNFDLKSTSYKLSLVKKRFATGKYIVEAS